MVPLNWLRADRRRTLKLQNQAAMLQPPLALSRRSRGFGPQFLVDEMFSVLTLRLPVRRTNLLHLRLLRLLVLQLQP